MKILRFSVFMLVCSGLFADLKDGIYAKFDTSKGEIIAELYPDQAPITVANFVGLAEGTRIIVGKPQKSFYDGLNFHRVIADFMIQGGCPLGTGTGGPGYRFSDETSNGLKHDKPGTLSMANAGPNTNGSQFFITHLPTPHLDGKHTVFGHVIKGMNVVNSIRKGDLINKIEIIRVGERAKAFDAEKVFRTDSLALEQLEKAEELQLLAKQKKEENEKYIAENYIDYKKLDSGIYKKITKQGQGPQVVEEDAVLCNFTLKLLSGIQLESSNPLNPAQFIVVKGRALPGIYEALKTVKVGESASFIIPPDLAFGEKQMGPITPFSYIIFDLDVKEIKKPRVP